MALNVTFRSGKPKTPLLTIAAFAVVALLPMYWFGLPSGNDQSQHYQFAWTVYYSVGNGDVYPSFAPQTNHGFGDYGIRFYPPVTYYVLAALRFVTGNWYLATLVALTLVFFVGALGVYVWARELIDERTALIAAALYSFIPYHLNEIYNNYLLAEFFATAILPWCFVFLDRAVRRPSARNTLALAASCALLVLTHLPLTLIGGTAMAIYAMTLLRRDTALRQIGMLLSAAVFTLAMTAFYWSRWVPEMAWITHNTPRYFSTTWDFRTNFLLVPSHWTHFGENALNLWFADLMLFVSVLLAVPALVIATRKDERMRFVPLASVFVIAVLMTTPVTQPLWDQAGFLQKVQFPWRWLSIVSLFSALLGAVGIVRAFDPPGKKAFMALMVAVSLAAVAFMTVTIFRAPVYVTRGQLDNDISTFGDSEGCDCWWPVWADRAAFAQKEDVVVPGRDVTIEEWRPTERRFSVSPGTVAIATIKTWYYPRWLASVNGQTITLQPDDEGALTLEIPHEASSVTVAFVEPWYVVAAATISVLAWLAFLFSSSIILLKSRRTASAA